MTRGLAAGSVRGKVRSMSLTASSVPGTFLALLDDQERAALFELGTRREFARGAVLMYEGEPGERVMVPEIGRVKMTRIEAGGHETRLSIRDPGDILGALSLIDEQPRWRLSLRSSRCESSGSTPSRSAHSAMVRYIAPVST